MIYLILVCLILFVILIFSLIFIYTKKEIKLKTNDSPELNNIRETNNEIRRNIRQLNNEVQNMIRTTTRNPSWESLTTIINQRQPINTRARQINEMISALGVDFSQADQAFRQVSTSLQQKPKKKKEVAKKQNKTDISKKDTMNKFRFLNKLNDEGKTNV
jgi:hypothetical protein